MDTFQTRCAHEDEQDRLALLARRQPRIISSVPMMTDEDLEALARYGVQPERIAAMRETRKGMARPSSKQDRPDYADPFDVEADWAEIA